MAADLPLFSAAQLTSAPWSKKDTEIQRTIRYICAGAQAVPRKDEDVELPMAAHSTGRVIAMASDVGDEGTRLFGLASGSLVCVAGSLAGKARRLSHVVTTAHRPPQGRGKPAVGVHSVALKFRIKGAIDHQLMAFSHGSEPMLFAAVSAKGILAVYNAKVKARLALISGQGRAKALQWSIAGSPCLAVANDERQVRVYRHEDILASGANAQPVWQGTAPEQVRCLAWTAHGHLLAGLRALRGENTAYIWAVPAPAGPVPGPACASLLPTLEPRDGSQWILGANARGSSPIAIPAGHGEIHAISASPDGRLLAIGGSEGIVQVADVVSGAVHGVYDKIAYVKWQLYLAHDRFAQHRARAPAHLPVHPSERSAGARVARTWQ